MSTPIKVLMVDDEEQFRATTKKILNKKGFETVLAGSGEEAITLLKEHPDVVILDIKMAGMGGHETLKEIKKTHPDLPVIMLTGHGSRPSAREALVEGAFDYLTKPCDINLLANKITEAYHARHKPGPERERLVRDVMISLEDYTVLDPGQTVEEAVFRLKESFLAQVSTSRLMETGHRSVLVMETGRLKGVLAIKDLLEALMPPYINYDKPTMADSLQYSPIFWKGLFIRSVREVGKKKISELMSPAPLAIEGRANLMEAAYLMVENDARRLVVTEKGDLAGILREQELFFEMEKILKK